jgi:hypothetical protein
MDAPRLAGESGPSAAFEATDRHRRRLAFGGVALDQKQTMSGAKASASRVTVAPSPRCQEDRLFCTRGVGRILRANTHTGEKYTDPAQDKTDPDDNEQLSKTESL